MKDSLISSKKSIILTKFCIIVLMFISVIMMFFGNYLIARFLTMTGGARINISKELSFYIITFISYVLGIIALCTLFCMFRLVSNLEKDKVFTAENIKWLRYISFGCLAAGSNYCNCSLRQVFPCAYFSSPLYDAHCEGD